jgi:hypothetical protein
MTTHWKKVNKAVNSQTLYNDIAEFVEGLLDEAGIRWKNDAHRESLVELLDEWLEEYSTDGKIEQWNVVMDRRNNSPRDMRNGKYTLDISYKQRNCLNTTTIGYTIMEQQ